MVEGMARKMMNLKSYAAESYGCVIRIYDTVHRAALLIVYGIFLLVGSPEIIGISLKSGSRGNKSRLA